MFTRIVNERPVSDVPVWALGLFVITLCMHIVGRSTGLDASTASIGTLPSPPESQILRITAAGEPEILSALAMLWLQSWDNQSGVSIPLADLDYVKLVGWLHRIADLDPRARYPMFSACHLYARVNNAEKQRQIIDFVHQRFMLNPDQNWQWLAHAVILAKHRLKDVDLATRLATDLRLYATGKQVPHWARQMEISLVETQEEYVDAALLIGGLIDSGEVTDPGEMRLLNQRLLDLRQKLGPAP